MRSILSLGRSALRQYFEKPDLSFDLYSPHFRQNPYPYYRELRDHHPVHYFKKQKLWAISRYEDVVMALKRPDLFSSVKNIVRTPTLIATDPPEHTRLRKMLSDFFSERSVARLEDVIQKHTNRAIDKILQHGNCELMSDLASVVPAKIISEIVGVDPERYQDVQRWTLNWILAEKEEHEQSIVEFDAFSEEHIDRCERHEGTGLIYDLLHPKLQEDKITRKEARDLLEFLSLAGIVTTTHLIGNAVLALLKNQDAMSLVKANLDFVPAVIEETLRYDPPAQMMPRLTTKDVEIAGIDIPAGSTLKLLLGSANRDERQFPDPDRFFIKRNPHGHLGFGLGIHHCLGARLARLEAQIIIRTLLLRLPGLRPAQNLDTVQALAPDAFHIRGVKRLELTFESS